MGKGDLNLTLEPEDNILNIDPETAKKRMAKSLDLGMALPLVKPGHVDQPFEPPHLAPGLFIPGTSIREPSTEPKYEPGQRPGGERVGTAPYSVIEHFSYDEKKQEEKQDKIDLDGLFGVEQQ